MSIAISAQEAANASLTVPSTPDSHIEGDWAMYRQRSAQALQAKGSEQWRTQERRGLALAYLGRRAQWHGGVYSSTLPTVLTAAVIARLAQTNAERRAQRYPFLAQMLSIVAELEREQHLHARLGGTVLSFPNHRRTELQAG